jgi:YVTN family beta-propeller protein
MRFMWGLLNRREHSRPFIMLALMTACGLLVTAAGPAAGREPQPAKTYLYVANHFDDTISVIDVPAKKIVATVPVGKAPSGVAVACQLDGTTVLPRGRDHLVVVSSMVISLSLVNGHAGGRLVSALV